MSGTAPSGRSFTLSTGRTVGVGCPTFVIAEIGQNHNGRLDWAEQLVDVAAWAGADAVKTVKRHLPHELTAEAAGRRYDSPHSFGRTYGEHRRALELDVAAHAALAKRARRHGLHFIATVCDVVSACEMHEIGVDAFKIASRDLNNLPLVEFVAGLGRPMILSTGMSGWSEIDAAVGIVARSGVEWAVMQCTSLYPLPDRDVHLRSLAALAEHYDAVVGFSDHTLGTAVAPAAVALGASLIEKHVTLDRNAKGSDHACSVEPEELRQLTENIRRVETALGSSEKPSAADLSAVRSKLGRSLVTRSHLAAGTVVDESMFVLKSPGDGVAWTERSTILGRRLVRDLPPDTLVRPADFS